MLVSPETAYKVRCLFIENSPIYRRWVTGLLESKIHFVEVSGFTEAQAFLLEPNSDVDFVLIDWEMIGIEGMERLREIRSKTKKPIILLAGRELSQQEFSEAMGSGVVSCLQKREVQRRQDPAGQGLSSLACEVLRAVSATTHEDIQKDLTLLESALSRIKSQING